MLTILSPLIVFGIVVFVHELGHFLAAKSVGVYAPRFSIGFGPALFRRRRGETEYVIAALPLGGYVRMASREDEASAWLEGGSEAGSVPVVTANDTPAVLGGDPEPRPKDWDPEAMMPFGPKPVPEHRWFESKSLGARLWILIAGVLMNVVLAITVYIGMALAYGKTVNPARVVGRVLPVPAVPGLAGTLLAGDTILAVAGRPVDGWNAIVQGLFTAPGDSVAVATQRGLLQVPIGAPETEQRVAAVLAIEYARPAVLDSVVPGEAAARGGLQRGDTIVAASGREIRTWPEVQEAIAGSPGRALPLVVRRGGDTTSITVVPDSVRGTNPVTGKPGLFGRIGVLPVPVARREAIGPGEAVVVGWRTTWEKAGEVLGTLRGLFSGRISVRQLGGPIAIARTSVEAARGGGLEGILSLVAFLSINVAILNLLPIPVLDGGQILMNIAERIKGSPFSARTRENVLKVGLAAIGLLFVTVMWNDIARIFREVIG